MSRSISTIFLMTLAFSAGYAAPCDAAAVKTTLRHFHGATDGDAPETPLLRDASGAFYGTTFVGGSTNNGVVFKLTPANGGTTWKFQVLHHFAGGADGSNPRGPMVRASTGVLFGATSTGGGSNTGTIFQLAPPPDGGSTTWTKTTPWDFDYNIRSKSPKNPMGGLLAGKAGVLYGTSVGGGANDYGTVFRMKPPPAGKTAWTSSNLHNFDLMGGAYPEAELIADSAGTLYSTANNGGDNFDGMSFSLTPPASGSTAWTKNVLVSHGSPSKGRKPIGGLTAGAGGEYYGTTSLGGPSNCGTVFKLTPPAPGTAAWAETVLSAFKCGLDGATPYAGLVRTSAGILYGSTYAGGISDHGTIFKLTPPAAGKTNWTRTAVYRFKGGSDGANPIAKLTLDPNGRLYGTTTVGGIGGKGTVFKLVP